MKISSLVDIVGGTLLNSPAISFITQIHTQIHKINDGDLFLSSSQEDIDNAITRGAFCIVTDNSHINIQDSEIAWILVDDINKASIKILRFLLANHNLQSYFCDVVYYEILFALNPDKTKYIFVNSAKELIEKIFTISDEQILISKNKQLIYDIYPKTQNFISNTYEVSNLTIHSLFEVSYAFNSRYYSKLRLPFIYLNHLLDVQNFYSLEIIDELKVKNIQVMQSIFLNKSLQIVDFGKSNRFIITSNNETMASLDKKFINSFYTYGKIDMVDVENFDEQTIYNIISKSKANCLYMIHCSNEKIRELLEKFTPKEELLFS